MVFNATTWRVQLPVNSSGGLSGTAITNWDPLKNYSPWYKKSLGTLYLKSPAKGAATSSGRAPRCELAQVQRWREAKCSFKTTLLSCDGKTTIFQVRQVGGSHEVIKVVFDAEQSEYSVTMNNYEDKFYNIPGEIGDGIIIRCSVGSKLDLRFENNGEEFAKFVVPTRYSYGKELQFKMGVYGWCNAQAKIQNLTWSIRA